MTDERLKENLLLMCVRAHVLTSTHVCVHPHLHVLNHVRVSG